MHISWSRVVISGLQRRPSMQGGVIRPSASTPPPSRWSRDVTGPEARFSAARLVNKACFCGERGERARTSELAGSSRARVEIRGMAEVANRRGGRGREARVSLRREGRAES